jgi:hypothetical protein
MDFGIRVPSDFRFQRGGSPVPAEKMTRYGTSRTPVLEEIGSA